jgi:crotonobetainyl-CoA:carnitine CoA-transferase CaiB-like acyl-CoA transferase
LGSPDWAIDQALSTVEGRRAAHDTIDERISEWTGTMSKRTVTATLQMFGVPSAPMFTASDQLKDPHYQARGYPRWFDQQGLGWMAYEGKAFHPSGMKDIQFFEAPLIGQHTRAIARELIGLDDETVDRYVKDGVLEVTEG